MSPPSVAEIGLLLGTCKSVRRASVGRLSPRLSAHEGRSRETRINRMMVKPHFSETQDDRLSECHRVNCKILSELYNFDFDE